MVKVAIVAAVLIVTLYTINSNTIFVADIL